MGRITRIVLEQRRPERFCCRINAFLDHVNVGDSVVCGSLEAYSCKLTGLDKQVSKSLDLEVQTDAPVAELATSPVGPLSEPSSRKTLVYLILTLNQCYPDYDFSQLRARHFRKEESASDVEGVVDSHLLSVSKVWEQNPRYGGSKFLDGLWSAIDEACDLADCDVYSYRTDHGDDTPFEEHTSIWSFNYFFYNRKLKRIVHFTCRSLSAAAADDGEPQSTPEVSLTTGDARGGEAADSDSEIVGGMDDVS